MYFHSLNIIRKQPEQSEIELIMIVFTDQEDVSDEEAEQYVQLLYDGKRPENVEVRPFLNLRKTSLVIQWVVVAAVLVFLPVGKRMILR